MIKPTNHLRGFTTPEVLFALIVVTIFVIGGFQLSTSVHHANLITNEQSQAANIAYEHLRQIANAITMNECPENEDDVEQQEVPPFASDHQRLPGLRIYSTVTAPYSCMARVLQIEVRVDYTIGKTNQTEKQVLYVQK